MTERRSTLERVRVIAPRLLAVTALGELVIGLAVLVFPGPLFGLLLDATLSGVGLVIARMLAIAIVALGVTWWLVRKDLYQQLKRIAPGFIGYNLAVGLLFVVYALTAAQPVPLSWAVALAHLLVGVTFSVAAAIGRRPARSDEGGPAIRAA